VNLTIYVSPIAAKEKVAWYSSIIVLSIDDCVVVSDSEMPLCLFIHCRITVVIENKH
jgi:hypothetical protein